MAARFCDERGDTRRWVERVVACVAGEGSARFFATMWRRVLRVLGEHGVASGALRRLERLEEDAGGLAGGALRRLERLVKQVCGLSVNGCFANKDYF